MLGLLKHFLQRPDAARESLNCFGALGDIIKRKADPFFYSKHGHFRESAQSQSLCSSCFSTPGARSLGRAHSWLRALSLLRSS
jgi:hypothetical protein